MTYKHCQSMKMTGETRPSETEAAEKSELSVSMIPAEKSKEEEKILMLSNALEELVVNSKEVEKISDKKGVEVKMTEIWEEVQISGNCERVKKKVVEIASDIGT